MNVGNGAVTFCSSVFQKFFSEVNIVAQFGVSVSHVRVLIQVLAAPLAVSLPASVPEGQWVMAQVPPSGVT